MTLKRHDTVKIKPSSGYYRELGKKSFTVLHSRPHSHYGEIVQVVDSRGITYGEFNADHFELESN